MAEVNLGQVLIGPDGEPFTKQGSSDEWTVKEIIMFVLKHGELKRKTMEGVIERCELAIELKKAEETISFTVNEAKLIQDCTLSIFGPFTVYALSKLLEGSGNQVDTPVE